MNAKVSVNYAGGSDKFAIPFLYLAKSFVKVKLNDLELALGIDYDVVDTTVVMHKATTSNDTITIYRKTDTTRVVTFHDGSVLREDDLTSMQLQLLHVIEEQGEFTITEVKENLQQLQIERTVSLKAGLKCTRGTLLGYQKGGFVKADNKNYKTLQNVVIALESSVNGKVRVLEQGEYAVNDLPDGNNVFVGADGEYRTTTPNVSGEFIKIVGTVEGDVIRFRPDSLAIQLA